MVYIDLRVDSWAVEPYLVDSINDGEAQTSRWKIAINDGWQIDSTMAAFCMDDVGDSTVYFDSSHLNPAIAGFYVATSEGSAYLPPTYSHIRQDKANYPSSYMYKMENKWMIGANIGVDSCFSFIEDDALTADAITSTDWRFPNATNVATDGVSWVIDTSSIISKRTFFDRPELRISNVYEAVREVRAIKSVPKNQKYISLRNNLPMPTMGLGTGGLYQGSETFKTLTSAMKLGYRLFDLAREYNNEKVFADVIASKNLDEELPYRDELFIETKVWPTDLGFIPTTDAIMTSLDHLDSNYVDLYLLHWPS